MATHRCHTTILFADLTSSTRIGESLDPELVAEVLGRLRKVAEDVISKHGGIVNQFYGDGVLAAFGFPEPQEDDVVQAISAALELHQAASGILPLPGIDLPGFEIQLHSGIHAGLVAVQEGDHIQGRYKLTGDALNTAARLSDCATPNELLVSAETIDGVLPYFTTDGIETFQLKGKHQPIDAYSVVSLSSVRTRYGASLSRGLSAFVGRSKELQTLERDFDRVQPEGARYLELCGDPGVGKTRLCEEFVSSRNGSELTAFKAYCVDSERGNPLQPFIQIMRSVFKLEPGMEQQQSLHNIDAVVNSSNGELSEFLDDYRRLLHLGRNEKKRISSSALVQRSVKATAKLVQHLATSTPVLLYLDDWHLSDELSQKTLINILNNSKDLPLFVLTATRTAMAELKYFSGRALHLQPFDLSISSQLVSSFFGYQLDLGFAASVHHQSGGNALFIEELCLSLPKDTAASTIRQGSDVPNTLQGLISKRMNQLPQQVQELVKVAAVLGNVFDAWLFEKVLGKPLSESQQQLLTKYNVIYAGGTQGTLRFKHGITREVSYEKIPLRERQRLHVRACEILEQQVKEQGGTEFLELLAYHYNGAKDALKTGYYSELAGDKALSTMALDSAGDQYRRALKVLDPATCEGSSYERWKSIIIKYGWVCVFDPLPDQLEAFERGVILANAYNDQEGMAKIEYWLGYIHYALGNPKPAIEHCERAIVVAKELNSQALLVEAYALLGQARGSAAQYPEALTLFDNALQKKSDYKKNNRPSIGSAYSLACKGEVLGDQGKFTDAFDCFESALQTLNGADHQVEASILGLYSCVKLWQGNWHDGRDLAENAQDVAQRISSSYMFCMYRALSGYAGFMLKENERALATIFSNTHGLELREKMLFGSLNYGWLSEILVRKEKWQQARKYAARAIIRARKGDRLGEAMAYRALAQLSDNQNSSAGVERYLHLAMESANARQSRHEMANNQFLRAKLAHQNGQFDKMEYYLDQARTAYQEMGMIWHEQQAAMLAVEHSASA